MNAHISVKGLHFSVSQMKAWLMCPKKYAYRYITGAEPEFVPMPLAFGSAFHAALAHHYGWLMRGELAPVDEVKQRFIETLTLAKNGPVPLQLDEEGTGFEEALAKGLQMLDVTLAHPSARPAKVVAVEQAFTVDLYDVEKGELVEERLMGFIDLVVEEDGHRVVVEHKTSSKKYSLDQLVYDTQLAAYAFAAEQLRWGEGPKVAREAETPTQHFAKSALPLSCGGPGTPARKPQPQGPSEHSGVADSLQDRGAGPPWRSPWEGGMTPPRHVGGHRDPQKPAPSTAPG